MRLGDKRYYSGACWRWSCGVFGRSGTHLQWDADCPHCIALLQANDGWDHYFHGARLARLRREALRKLGPAQARPFRSGASGPSGPERNGGR